MDRPIPPSYDRPLAQKFVDRWRNSASSERANAQLFVGELCDLLGVERPRPKKGTAADDTYCFERDVIITHPDGHTSTGFIDLYKRAHFVFEAKQGSEATDAAAPQPLIKPATKKRGTAVRGTGGYDVAMQDAYVQAERYARALDEWPPFLVVCDVGFCFELYASFDGSGKYRAFPTPQDRRIAIEQVAEPAAFALLHGVFTDPLALDPSREAAKVTREIAAHLARLAHSLEDAGHAPEQIAKFLMRCLFTMFSEDVGLLPAAQNGEGLFTHAIEQHWLSSPDRFTSEVESLWRAMNTGGALFGFAGKILQFNGGLFVDPTALPMNRDQLAVLLLAAQADWAGVEPAIFGTLLERALNPKERHRLGAHFTPRAYVERLVAATIEEPLRADWNLARAEVRQLFTAGKINEAREVLKTFHRRLVDIRVLDPACGTGNFLYVTLDLFKRIEAEVFADLADLGETQTILDAQGLTVHPGQFIGLEVKPWAREIADLVLWIGYLQWYRRTRRKTLPPEPVLRDYKNIVCRDALIEYDGHEPVRNADGTPLTRWDGETTKRHPVTGEDVPDDTARVPVVRYLNPLLATWPQADFIVGNPPFIGNKRMRTALGDGYVEAVRTAHANVPETSDFVMYWWDHAARLTRTGDVRRFGLITTNSITQTFNRKVVQAHLDGSPSLSIVFALPDHPWVDSADGADVRIAMTAAEAGGQIGALFTVTEEVELESGEHAVTGTLRRGQIHADLSIGAAVVSATPLLANEGLSFQGPIPLGEGFRLDQDEVRALGYDPAHLPPAIKRYVIGRDIVQRPEERYVIDFFGLGQDEAAAQYPALYQHVLIHVKPERDQNRRDTRRRLWWLFGENAPKLRRSVDGLRRFIVTVETSKHKPFVFLEGNVCPDHKLYTVASDDAFVLGVLSSQVHLAWALAAGGALGVGNDPTWTNTTCFLPFPFPAASDGQREQIRDLGERIDSFRKERQRLHPNLRLTDIYNVLSKLRGGEALSDKEKRIHDEGLVSVLKQLHEELDWAVMDAYGWPVTLTDAQILEKLVTLNVERTAEERRGLIRWLRPAYQNPTGVARAAQTEIAGTEALAAGLTPPDGQQPRKWPKDVPAQLAAIKALFDGTSINLSVDDVCAALKGARKDKVLQHLASLEELGLLDRYESGGVARWHA